MLFLVKLIFLMQLGNVVAFEVERYFSNDGGDFLYVNKDQCKFIADSTWFDKFNLCKCFAGKTFHILNKKMRCFDSSYGIDSGKGYCLAIIIFIATFFSRLLNLNIRPRPLALEKALSVSRKFFVDLFLKKCLECAANDTVAMVNLSFDSNSYYITVPSFIQCIKNVYEYTNDSWDPLTFEIDDESNQVTLYFLFNLFDIYNN